VAHLLSICELVDSLDSSVVSFADLTAVQPQLQQLLRGIHSLLDLDGAESLLAVRAGVNSALDGLRTDLSTLDTFLDDLARGDRLAAGDLHGIAFQYIYAQQPGFYLTMEEQERHLIRPGSMQYMVGTPRFHCACHVISPRPV
jgi:hypothetical protein